MLATHYSDVTVERVVLIYAILMSLSIDVGQVMFNSIIHTVKHKLGLYFPSLITQLCIQAGFQYSSDDESQYPKKPLNDGMLTSIKVMRRKAPAHHHLLGL